MYMPIAKIVNSRVAKKNKRKQKKYNVVNKLVRVSLYAVMIFTMASVMVVMPAGPMANKMSLVSSSEKKSGLAAPRDAYVNIKGFVIKPGMYKVPDNVTIKQVVNEAQGLALGAEVHAIKLEQKIEDGMVIYVPGKIIVK